MAQTGGSHNETDNETPDDAFGDMFGEALDEAADAIAAQAPNGPRLLVGLTGAPGVGKSTFAAYVTRQCNAVDHRAVVVPMDGFHFSNTVLRQLGRSARKGAPDTFDVDGFIALLARVRGSAEPVYAPCFHRELEESFAAEIVIEPSHEVVLVDGNYLLLDGPWSGVRPLLDLCIHLRAHDNAFRIARLVARHVEHGRSPVDALEWVERSDEANARVIEAAATRADRVILL